MILFLLVTQEGNCTETLRLTGHFRKSFVYCILHKEHNCFHVLNVNTKQSTHKQLNEIHKQTANWGNQTVCFSSQSRPFSFQRLLLLPKYMEICMRRGPEKYKSAFKRSLKNSWHIF